MQLDVVELKPTSDKLVVVSASDISRGLEASGRVAVYGILFDSNKSDVKPESRAALEEIAKYLRSNVNAKLDVVGHTDNVGSYDSNLDLSRARAAAVVSALVGEYNINTVKGLGRWLLGTCRLERDRRWPCQKSPSGITAAITLSLASSAT